MVSNELVGYVTERRKEGFSDDRIRTVLQSAGYASLDVEAALRDATVTGAQQPSAGGSFLPPAQPSEAAVSAGVSAMPSSSSSAPAPVTPVAGGSKTKRVIIFTIVGVLVTAGVASAAYVYLVPPSPQSVIAAMFHNGISNIHSLHEDSEFSLAVNVVPVPVPSASSTSSGSATTTTSPAAGNAAVAYANELVGAASGTVTFSASASSSYDGSNPAEPQADTSFTLGFGLSGPSENFSWSAAAEMRLIDNVFYAELTKVPVLGAFDMTPYENQWVSIALNSSTLNQLDANPMVPPLSLPSGVSASSSLSAGDIQSLESALGGAVQIMKTLPDETLDGVATYHYQYAITKPGILNLVATAASIEHVSSTVSAQAVAQVGNILNAVQSMGGEIWIGKSDHTPRQISFDLSFATTTAGYALSGAVNATSTFSAINQPQNITAPQGAEDLSQLLGAFTAGNQTAQGLNLDR